MRTKQSMINSFSVAMTYIVKIMLTFVTKTFVIKVLGDNYNGLDGLFTSIISMLSIVELGIGMAITYNLYRPVKDNKIEEIKSIIDFYRKCYTAIGICVLLMGVCIIPLLPSLIGEVNIKESITVIYIFFLLDAVCTYFYSYKQSILIAYQQGNIISNFLMVKILLLQVIRMIIIVILQNYLLYVFAAIVFDFGMNISISFYVNRRYAFLKSKIIQPLSKDIKHDIKEKVKGLLFHKIGGYIVLGTDNILISKLVGVIEVGLYSNYILIVNVFEQLIGQMIDAIVPSLANLLLEDQKDKNYSIYKKILHLSHFLFGIVSITFFAQVNDFICLWIGERYIFDCVTIYFISINLYIFGMRKPLAVFESALGVFYPNRFIPLFESATNLIVSIVLGSKYGLVGIIIGTTFSSAWIFFCDYPKYIWKSSFVVSVKMYYRDIFRCLMEWNILLFICYWLKMNLLDSSLSWLAWTITSLLFVVLCFIMFLILHIRDTEIMNLKNLVILTVRNFFTS